MDEYKIHMLRVLIPGVDSQNQRATWSIFILFKKYEL